MPSQQVLQKKISEVEEVAQLIKKYKVIGIASLQKVRAAQLQEFKRNLADKVFMRVIQNTLMKRAIDNSKEKPELKKEGILAHIRHPLYLGLILMFTGYFFFSPTLTNLVAWACTMLYLPFGIASEEKKLVREFGEAYTNYQKEVPMLIPKKKFLKRKK